MRAAFCGRQILTYENGPRTERVKSLSSLIGIFTYVRVILNPLPARSSCLNCPPFEVVPRFSNPQLLQLHNDTYVSRTKTKDKITFITMHIYTFYL